jgi:uncharacterized phage protein (TIGR02218 family)
MAGTNIGAYEFSQQDGKPIECYRFTYDIGVYTFTSHHSDVMLTIDDNGLTRTETYFATYIERNSIKPASKGDSSALSVTVSKDNSVAKLFQGFPPEKPVMLTILRFHEQDKSKRDIIFSGRVGQASFEDSDCVLTVKLESWANRELPNGMRQFYCNNVIYDHNCQLVENDWKQEIFIDKVEYNVNIYSEDFRSHPDGYFVGGLFRHEGSTRLITEHVGNRVKIKYPFVENPHDQAVVAPGCDHLFKTCALRFGNTLNFTGCPYVPPANPERTNIGRGVYWVDSQVVQRDTDGYVGTISF